MNDLVEQRRLELEEAKHRAKLLRLQEASHHDVLSQKQWRKGIDVQTRAALAGVELGRAKLEVEKFEIARSVFTQFWPVLAGILIILFLLGPGFLAIMTLFESINIWVWFAIIFIWILFWRNRR